MRQDRILQIYLGRIDLTLWLQSFFWVNFLQTFTWHGHSFSMFTVWHELFFFGTHVFRVEN